MSIGAGIILMIIALFLLVFSMLFNKKNKRIFLVTMFVGILFLLISLLILTGVYDPYSNHLN